MSVMLVSSFDSYTQEIDVVLQNFYFYFSAFYPLPLEGGGPEGRGLASEMLDNQMVRQSGRAYISMYIQALNAP